MNQDNNGIGMTSSRTRERMIQRLRSQGITDEKILTAMAQVPRHLFVDEALSIRAYEDTALPIGYGQTISQPYIVALMTQTLSAGQQLKKILEIGTGCGYQTAVLASLAEEVYSVERLEPLYRETHRRLLRLGYKNVRLKLADGSWGWPEHGPYDGIIVTAAAAEIPAPLLEQLALRAHLVIPVGDPDKQELLLVKRSESGLVREHVEWVNFVPMIKDRL